MKTIVKVRNSDGVVVGSKSWLDDATVPPGDNEITYYDRPAVMNGAGFGKKFRRNPDGSFEEFIPPPTAREVLTVRFNELAASDWTAVADREPMPEWVAYRKALRDLTAEGKTVEAMMALFPKRPDGVDAIAHLRSRLHG